MMQFLHYNITLSKTHRIELRTVRILLFFIVIISVTLMIRHMLYPTYHFDFLARIDSLANTISRPFITAQGTAFDIATDGDFTQAHITITLAKDAPTLPNAHISAYHSYSAFLAPISNEKYTAHITRTRSCGETHYIAEQDQFIPLISKNARDSYIFSEHIALPENDSACTSLTDARSTLKGFRSGTLISSQEGIFVTDGDTKHPFQDEIVFSALGYTFDNVISTTSEERSIHKKARMMTIDSTHPFGTIFFARDADRMYIYDADQLHKIAPQASAQKLAIIVDERSRDTTASCTLARSFLHKHTYTCTMPLEAITAFPGNTFRFVIDTSSVDIARSHISLSTAPTQATLQKRLTHIKNELRKYYAQP